MTLDKDIITQSSIMNQTQQVQDSWLLIWKNLANNSLTINLKDRLYARPFLGACTEEVYWLRATQYKYNRRTSTQTQCKTIVVVAQQENKGKQPLN
jgi:hypothetical protein